MKNKISLVLFMMVIFTIILPVINAADADTITKKHTIDISTSEKGLLIEENVIINNTGNENVTSIKFWIQQNSEDVKVLAVDSAEELTAIVTGNIRECNLTEHNITLKAGGSINLRLTYTLLIDTDVFQKRISYYTESITVSFKGSEIYQAEKVQSDSFFSLQLYRPTEAPLPIIYIGIIFVLVIVIIGITLLLLRKQRTKVKKSIVESEEMLTTKKTLLMSLLKDLEKQHRKKDISDETYDKLKEEYKQQAVDAMKKLEDLKK